MKLFVEAPVAAGLLRTDRDDDVLVGALLVRKRYALQAGFGLAEPHAELGSAEIRLEAVDCGDYGELPPDEVPPRTGTDVIVLGDVVRSEAVTSARVEVKVGEYNLALDVYGERRWEGVLGMLTPSSPEPFVRMPLTYRNAYGGSSDFSEYGPIPWYMNPVGKGYYLRSSEAHGRPLPNIESAAAKIKAWDDRPPPAGLSPYPARWGLRYEQFVEVLPETEKLDVHPERGMYDRAHPSLSGKLVAPGPMSIGGMTAEPVTFDIPECPVEARIQVGSSVVTREFELEEVLVDLRKGCVDLGWRKMFRYHFVKHERRQVHVLPRAAAV